MRPAPKHQSRAEPRWISYGPAPGGYGAAMGRHVVGAVSQQELLDLEKLHAAAAEKAELEARWSDAAKEWDLAAALASQYAVGAGNVEKEQAHQRWAEYRRRKDAAQASASTKGGGKLGTVVLAAAGAGVLYLVSPGLALGALAAVWSGAKRAGSYVAGKAKGAVT